MILTPSQAQKFYDHFGAKQDSQAFYEDTALDELIAHSSFEQANSVFEFGCGTGRFASRLLAKHLSPSASYFGIDISKTMTDIASKRISPYAGRASVAQADGAMVFPLPDHCVDRVVSTYVFDLLSETDIQKAVSEAARVLTPGGKLCLVSLTKGNTIASRVVSSLWTTIFHLNGSLVGGCRPIRIASLIEQQDWKVEYCNVLSRFGVPSEIHIMSPTGNSDAL